jgi:hypothetical protein
MSTETRGGAKRKARPLKLAIVGAMRAIDR